MHLVHARRLRCPNIDDGSLHIDEVKFSAYADSTDYAVPWLMEHSRPDFPDQSFAWEGGVPASIRSQVTLEPSGKLVETS